MIRHTLTPLPSGNFLLKMFDEERCLQTTEVTREDAETMYLELDDCFTESEINRE